MALEKLVEAGLGLSAFSTLDHMASTVRAEVNAAICAGIWERAGGLRRAVSRGERARKVLYYSPGPQRDRLLLARRAAGRVPGGGQHHVLKDVPVL